MIYKILWTNEAVNNLEHILHYISSQWTEKEVAHFKRRLVEQLNIISKFPSIFPTSATVPRLRKAVLSKQTTIFYEVREEVIYIVYLFDNRQNPEKLK
jgi:plasmid stabilization system protein ParE